jgi:hypothetical protein
MRMESTSLRPHQTAIVAAAIAAVVGYLVPLAGTLLLPLQYLNTHLHELGHAMAAVVTGGHVEHILIRSDGSGVTPISGGLMLLIGPAGYVGAACIGAVLIYYGRTENGARVMLRALAIIMSIGLLLWLRGDLFGIGSGIVWIGALFGGASLLKGRGLLFAAQFLGIQQCLTSLQAVFGLLQISAYTGYHSDARLMQDATMIPAVVWAFGWCLLSLVLIVWTLRAAWNRPAPA